MTNRYKSSFIRFLKGALAAGLMAFLNYLAAHFSTFVAEFINDPAKQALAVSIGTGIILFLEKFIRWTDNP